MNKISCAIRLKRKGILGRKDFLDYSKQHYPNKGGTEEFSIISSCWDHFKQAGVVNNVPNNGRNLNKKSSSGASTSGTAGSRQSRRGGPTRGNRRSRRGASTRGTAGRGSGNGASTSGNAGNNNKDLKNVTKYGFEYHSSTPRDNIDLYIYSKPDIFSKFGISTTLEKCQVPSKGAGIYSNMNGKLYNFIMLYDKSMKTPVAFAELIGNGNRVEVYNVCTILPHRRKGLANLLMQEIVILARKNNLVKDIVLGVLLNQNKTNFNSKVRLYAKSGFLNDANVRNKSFSGMNIPHFLMKYNKEELKGVLYSNNNMQNTINKSKMYYERFHEGNRNSVKTVHIRLTINQENMKKIKDYQRSGNTETGGLITVEPLKYNKNNKIYTTTGAISNVVNGNKQWFQVMIPNINKTRKAIISWHTHPSICYKKYGACMGTPSAGDYNGYLRTTLNNGQIANFVFAEECIYVCGLRDISMSILSKHKQDPRLYEVVNNQLKMHIDPFDSIHKSPSRHGYTVNQSSPFTNGPHVRFVAPNGTIKNAIWNFVPQINVGKAEEFFTDYMNRLNNITIRSVLIELYAKYGVSVNMSLHPRYNEVIYDTPVFHCSPIPHNNYDTAITTIIPYGMFDLKKNLA